MYIYIKRLLIPLVLALGVTVMSTASVEARLVYSTEEDGVHTPAFNLDKDDTSDDFVDLNFGASSGAQLRYDVTEDKFFLNRDLDLGALELQDFKIERLAVAPTCGPTDAGRMYFNTTSDQTFVCDGATFNVLENAGAVTGADITDGSIGDEDLDLADITLLDFTNDAGFLTTVDMSDDTNLAAGTGATLTGDTISVDLGTDIATGELQDNAVTSAKILDSTIVTGDIANGTITAADLNLTDITLNDFTNDANFLTTVDISDDTNLAAGTGATLTGDTISVDLGTTIDSSEIEDETIVSADIDDGTITAADLGTDSVNTDEIAADAVTITEIGTAGLADANSVLTTDATGNPQWEDRSNFATSSLTTNNIFVGVAGVATDTAVSGDLTMTAGNFQIAADAVTGTEILDGSVDVSDDTNLAAGTGATLTGDTISVDLGTSIETGEIGDNQVTLAKIVDGGNNQVLTSDATGNPQWEDKSIFATSAQGSLADTALQSGDNISELVNDAGFVTTDNDTTYTGSGGITLTGTNFTADLGTTIETGEITDGTITFADLNSTDITLLDFTNDAGFVTTDNDTTYTGGTGITIAGTTINNDFGNTIETGEITDGTITAADLNLTDIDLADFTNAPGFLTTVDISGDTNLAAGTGATLTGDTISVDLGTSIETGEIGDNQVTLSKIVDGGNNQVLTSDATGNPQWEDKSIFATSAQGSLADTALQSGDNISELVNDAGFVTTDNDTTYTASDGITLTGTNFTNDFSTAIETGEITDGTITAADLNLTDITLNDFTNDANFLTTVDISDDTNLAAGTGATLTGDTISVDLGTTIDSSEIEDETIVSADIDDGTITAADLGTDSVNTDEIAADAVTITEIGTAGLADANSVLTTDATGNPQWEDRSNFATSSLTTNNIFVGVAGVATDTAVSGDLTMTAGNFQIAADAVTGTEILDGSVDVSDDTNLAAGTGATLTGDTISVDLGTSIETGEIGDNQVTLAKIVDGGNNQVLTSDATGNPQWEDKSIFATSAQGSLADTALQSGDNISELVNDAGFVTTDNDTTYTGSGGITLTGTNFTADLGTTIETGEITDGTITFADLNSTDITLLDFTNDAGFVTTDNDTTYTGGTGITIAGTTINNDFGNTIETGEITDGTITAADLNLTDIDLADFTNAPGFLTTVDISDDTNLAAGTGATLTGDTLSVDLGTTIDSSEIEADTIEAVDINTDAVGSDELADDAVDTAAIQNDAVTVAKIGGAGNNQVLTSDGSGNPQWEDRSNFATNTLTTNNILVGVAGVATDTAVSGDLTMTAGNFQIAADAVTGTEILDGSVDVSDDTNLAAGTGATLTGDTISVDLGTSIETGEIGDNQVTLSKIVDGGNNQVLTSDATGNPQWEDKSIFATSAQGSLADTALQSGDNISELVNDAGFVTTDNDTTYTASDGITLTGTNFTNDFSTAIETGEITDGTITAADLNLTDITLNDFTNDANFLTTVDVSDNTNLAAGTGATLTGDTISVDLGTSIETGEIGDNQVTLSKIIDGGNNQVLTSDATGNPQWEDKTVFATSAQGALADTALQSGDNISELVNDAGFITTDNDTTYTASDGITLTGTNFTNDFSTAIETGEITDGTITAADLNLTDITLNDFTNDANFLTTVDISDDTNLAAGTGATLTGDTISVDLGTSIDSAEIELNTIVADDINTDAVGSDELADDAVDTAAIQNNAVDGSKIALGGDTQGDIMFYNGTDWDRLAAGTGDQVLQMNPGATAPVWNDSTATKYQFLDIFGCIRGSASAGTVAGGNSPVVRFDGGNNSQMRCALPVPSDWQTGTDINVEVYYSPSDNTAGDVSFVLRHAAFGVTETVTNGAFTDTLTGPETITASTELDIYELTGDIPAATLAADDMININLRREPGDAADTYAGDINIHQIRISYTGKELQ